MKKLFEIYKSKKGGFMKFSKVLITIPALSLSSMLIAMHEYEYVNVRINNTSSKQILYSVHSPKYSVIPAAIPDPLRPGFRTPVMPFSHHDITVKAVSQQITLMASSKEGKTIPLYEYKPSGRIPNVELRIDEVAAIKVPDRPGLEVLKIIYPSSPTRRREVSLIKIPLD